MFPLADQQDHEILMHRDAHFAGQFPLMLEYYEKGGKGVQPEFELERIQELTLFERELGSNLADIILLELEKEKVAESQQIYLHLRKASGTTVAAALARLILSEEEHPEAEINAIVREKEKAVEPLINLLKTEHFHDPLFPGYGLAPQLAAEALGQIGDKKAIITLFESLTEGDFFDDEASIRALQAIGQPARDFLLKVVHAKPFTIDNDRAAIALVAFKDDPVAADACFKLLQDPTFQKEETFLAYLILTCEGLSSHHREAFKEYAETLPKNLKLDAQTVINSWNS